MKSLSSLSIAVLFLFSNNVYTVLGDVYCDSYECDNQYVYQTQNLYCRGYESCVNSYVYVTGTGDSVYCTGDNACAESNITSNNAYIYVYGYMSAYESKLDSNSGTYCYGYQGCYDAEIITHTNHVECMGYYSCQLAYIRDTQTVNGFGYYALQDAIVDSQDETNVYINLIGYRAGNKLEIYCREDSSCILNCGSSDGCYNTEFYCYSGATCSYDCDDSDSCPELWESSTLMKMYNKELTNEEIDSLLYEKELENKIKKEIKRAELKNKNINKNTNEYTNKLLASESIVKNIQGQHSDYNFYLIIAMFTSLIAITSVFYSLCLCYKNKQLNSQYRSLL